MSSSLSSNPTSPWQQVLRALEQQRVPHAWLLTGRAGSGVRDFAMRIAKALVCQQPQNHHPCNKCQSCHLFETQTHPDIQCVGRVDSAVIKVDQIRALNQFLQQSRHLAPTQVAVIEHADALHRAAANALLKTLEEPTANTVILLLAQQTGSIPATIRSRCQHLNIQSQHLDDMPAQDLREAELISLETDDVLDDLVGHFDAFIEHLHALLQNQCTPLVLTQRLKDIPYVTNLCWQMKCLEYLVMRRFELNETLAVQFSSLQQLDEHCAAIEVRKCYALIDEIQQLIRFRQQSINQQLALEQCYMKWQQLKGVKDVRTRSKRANIG